RSYGDWSSDVCSSDLGIDLAGTAIHEQEDHTLGFGQPMRLPGRERVRRLSEQVASRCRRGEEAVERKQPGQGQPGETGACLPERSEERRVGKGWRRRG